MDSITEHITSSITIVYKNCLNIIYFTKGLKTDQDGTFICALIYKLRAHQ
jgi:hypothetical protein